MSKRNKNIDALKNEKLVNRLRIFLIAALVVLIFYPPYLQGLFFEKHVLPTQIFVFILFIIFLVYKCLKKDYAFFKTPIEFVSIGFVIVYFISIFVAVHTRSAIIEWLKYCMYFTVFYMISDLADNLKAKMIFIWTIVVSAVGVSIIGLDAALGGNIVGLLNKFFKLLGAKGDLLFGLVVGNRIHSTLQYPNALASYLMAVFYITVGLLMVYSKWWQKAILGVFSYILFLTFMLTQSRGAQLLFPVGVVILLLGAPKFNRIKVVTHVLLLAIPASVMSLFISPYLSTENLNHKALILVITGLVLTVLISVVIKILSDILQKINWRIYAFILLVFIVAIVIGVNYTINSYIPVELSLLSSEENKLMSISKDIALKPDKEYILRFKAEGKMEEEKPYVFSLSVINKNIKNILFSGSNQLVRKNFSATDGVEEYNILFSTKSDTKIINVSFSIYYSGTSVKINNASIIDAKTGRVVKNIILKNKYNLDNIMSRFQNIWLQPSLVSRAIFYKDGLKIFKDKWLLGAGGGAWGYLYRQYQSYNYSSSQAHNYPLQLGIETGFLGITVLIGLVIVLIYNYVKYKKVKSIKSLGIQEEELNVTSGFLNSAIITSIASLFMHSVIDFDFAESSMLLLFWQLIALHNREFIDKFKLNGEKLIKKNTNIIRNKLNINNKKILITGIAISAVILYFSTSFFIASSFAKQSYENLQNDDIETAISKMEKAIMLDKYNEKYVIGYNPIQNRPDIKAGLTDILFFKNQKLKSAQEKGEKIPESELSLFKKQLSKANLYIKDVEKKAKNNLSLTSDLASYYFKIGEIDKGINCIEHSISYFPFEPSLWHSKVDVYYQLMSEYFNREDYEKAKEYLIKGLNVIDEAKNANKMNMNPFVFNKNTVELLQIMKYMQDNWDTNAIFDVNKIVHYSMFDLDVNLDDIPDQWQVYYGKEQILTSITEGNFEIKTSVSTSLYTRYPLKFESGKTYLLELKLANSVNSFYYNIQGIGSKVTQLDQLNDNYYKAEFIVESNDANNNQLELFFNSDCVIEEILVIEKP